MGKVVPTMNKEEWEKWFRNGLSQQNVFTKKECHQYRKNQFNFIQTLPLRFRHVASTAVTKAVFDTINKIRLQQEHEKPVSIDNKQTNHTKQPWWWPYTFLLSMCRLASNGLNSLFQ